MEEINKLLVKLIEEKDNLIEEKDDMKNMYRTEDLLLRMFRDRKLCFKQNVTVLNMVLKCSEKINLLLDIITHKREVLLKIRSAIEFVFEEIEGQQFRDFYLLICLNLRKYDSNLEMKYSKTQNLIRPDDVSNTHWWWHENPLKTIVMSQQSIFFEKQNLVTVSYTA